jgi:hypothetical protein
MSVVIPPAAPATDQPANSVQPLRFVVAPHIVQDLGINLYTSLSRVLVEFVANAHDADATSITIAMDKAAIDQARRGISAAFRYDVKMFEIEKKPYHPLEERTLPPALQIVIEDNGHGMSRTDLQDKYLHAGRRRREEEKAVRSPKGRVLMGRKGLGKLAGFGVARVMTLISRAAGEAHATKITLDYAELIRQRDTKDISIPETTLEDGGNLPATGGTRIILTHLFYSGTGNRMDTVENEIGDHFGQIDPEDFAVRLNGQPVEPTPRNLVFAWPEPDQPIDRMIDKEILIEDGRSLKFKYRMRFTARGEALNAKERGVRVYAHRRLAAIASLLQADTNMHGFRMTDYLDGVVIADFIDDQPADYIATDRQGLRWDTPLLQPMYEFLSAEIKEACKQRQKRLDDDAPAVVVGDAWTKQEIESAGLSKRHEKLAYRIASTLESVFKKGVGDNEYKTYLPPIVRGLGHGGVLTAISKMAAQERPDLHAVAVQITKLTAEELDHFLSVMRGRLDGITALKKICEAVDFKKSNNEGELHALFNQCPWLIDPTFFEFLATNQTEESVYQRLAKDLQIGAFVPSDYDPTAKSEVEEFGRNLRPDLVFLLGNVSLSRLVIVELKAPNTPLYGEHYRQLQDYVLQAEEFLRRKAPDSPCSVSGILIGSMPDASSKAKDVRWLFAEIEKTRNIGQCRVYDILHVLRRTEDAHREILEAEKRVGAQG